jgi:hypothetical protein
MRCRGGRGFCLGVSTGKVQKFKLRDMAKGVWESLAFRRSEDGGAGTRVASRRLRLHHAHHQPLAERA